MSLFTTTSPSATTNEEIFMGTHVDAEETTYHEQKLDIDELEKKFNTDRHLGLTANVAAQMQAETPKLNLLPTDLEAGHGNIHELVGVLRDGDWIHTRAENLLQGDIISLKEDQCVPADVRIIESHDLWIDQSVLFGKRNPEQKNALTSSVFDDSGAGISVPYLEAMNIAFYGTLVVKGNGKAMVIRTGADTILGKIATCLIEKKQKNPKKKEIKLTEEMKRIDMRCENENDLLPSEGSNISTFVVEHGEIIKTTIVSASFSVNPPVIVHLEDQILANEATTEELEKEIALQMMTTYQKLETCRLLMKALAPHHMRIPPPPPTTTTTIIMDSSRSSSTIQHAISRFCTHFSMFNSTSSSSSSSSPRTHQTSSHRFISSPYPYRTRCATLAHGQVSGCDVFVQFDPSVGQHVVFLQGPAREVLSRCSTIRHDHHEEGTSTLAKLDTSEIKNLEAMIQELEKKHQKVISFAEFLLEKNLHFSFEKQVFDFKNLNFPTKNLCYLGSIGIIEKIQPELVHLATKANETNVRLFITSHFCQYPFFLFDDKNKEKEKEKQQLVPVTITKFPILLQQEMNNKNITFSKKKIMIEACVYHSEALCISNTLNEWKQILMNFPLVIFDACTPNQMDLLVETLQEMGEKVALVASGSANAFALAKANLGFSIPTTIHSTTDCFVDLSQVGADIIMGIGSSSSSSPRCDAIQIVQLAKKQANPIPLQESSSPFGTINQGTTTMNTKSNEAVTNVSHLFKEVISAARLMGLSEKEIQVCFDSGMNAATSALSSSSSSSSSSFSWSSPPATGGLLSSPSKYPASAFRRENTGNELSGTPFSPIASSFTGSSLV